VRACSGHHPPGKRKGCLTTARRRGYPTAGPQATGPVRS
jgi:hypothetical protein